MFRIVAPLLLLLSLQSFAQEPTNSTESGSWFSLSNSEFLLSRIEQINRELETLPEPRLSPAPWSLGYRSTRRNRNLNSHRAEIEIEFARPTPVDLVVLMPSIFVDGTNRIQPVGFPKRFLLELIFADGTSEVIADYSTEYYPPHGVEPQLFPCPDNQRPSTGLRLQVIEMGEKVPFWKGTHRLILNEIIALNGAHNIALGANVIVDDEDSDGQAWNSEALVDGSMHFNPIMPSLEDPYREFFSDADRLEIDIDLEDEYQIDELRIWPTEFLVQHKFPHSHGMGFPGGVRVERISELRDREQGKLVYFNDKEVRKPGTGPLVLPLNPTTGRYFRFIFTDPYLDPFSQTPERFALSEIELLEKGKVVSTDHVPEMERGGRVIRDNFRLNRKRTLTNGKSSLGEIQDIREWLIGLSRRASLEAELTRLEGALAVEVQKERDRLTWIAMISVATIIILALLTWIARLLYSRRWTAIRERIAGDIHDEIGANISGVAISHDMIKRTISNPTQLQDELLNETAETLATTRLEIREIARFLEGRPSDIPQLEKMEMAAKKILGNVSYIFDHQNPAGLIKLNAARRWDLLLFFKEALNNVVRHSGASRVGIRFEQLDSSMQLTVRDNGCGIAEDRMPLHHLEKRARRLHGKLRVETETGRGTTITLQFK